MVANMSNNVTQELQTTAFGSLSVDSIIPVSQISAHLGLLNNVLTVTDDAATGTNTIVDGKYSCSTGASSDGLASITTLRQATYRPGQGAMARITALFSTPSADSLQAAGLITAENAFVFGYAGVNFGIIHSHDGVVEIQTLTLAVPGGAENVTVTIDGTPFVVALSGGGTLAIDAYEISQSLNSQVNNFNFTSNGSTVTSIAQIPRPGGSYAYVGSASVGVWFQDTDGLEPITDFIPQALWNTDTRISTDLDVNLDPLKGNVYQIQYQYLGFGAINFFVEDKESGAFVLVHRIRYANTNTIPSVTNPTFRAGWLARNTGNTSDITVQGGSAALFIEGIKAFDSLPRTLSVDKSAIGTSDTSMIIVRNRTNFAQKINRAEIFPKVIHASTQANKFAFFKMFIQPTFASPVNFQYVNQASSVAEFSLDTVEVTGGFEVSAFTVVSGAPQSINLNTFAEDAIVFPGDVVVITAQVPSGAAGDCQATTVFVEDL